MIGRINLEDSPERIIRNLKSLFGDPYNLMLKAAGVKNSIEFKVGMFQLRVYENKEQQ